MEELVERIRREGVHAGGGIVKLDGFINHQVDASLTERMGDSFVRRFAPLVAEPPTRIVTAEVSGIPAALATARRYDVPMLYARKHRSSVMTDVYYFAQAKSRTKGEDINLMISRSYLGGNDRVIIIDDFLATGSTISALASLVEASGATLLGIGCVIEKPLEHGRERLSGLGVPIETLARVEVRDEAIHVY